MWSRRLSQTSLRPSKGFARHFGSAPKKHDGHDNHHDHHAAPAGEHSGLTPSEFYKKIGGIQGYFMHQQDFFMRHNPPNKKWTLTEILRTLPTSKGQTLIKMLAKQTTWLDTERPVSEVYNPPKIHENSVFLYQSEKLGGSLLKARRLEAPLYAGLVLAFPSFALSISLFGTIYLLLSRASHYELGNRLVLRMDLLPHLESIAFQKIGPFGVTLTKIVRLSDLEKIEPNFSEENAFWGYNIALDRDLVYRDNSTGELFVFDSNGLWSWEGISHKLLY